MKNSIKRICDNCIVIGNDVISYETKVGLIDYDNKELKELGKYSSTTSKHVNRVCLELGLLLIPFKK